MKIHNVEQNTPEWMALRAGLPTASCFDKIITPTGWPSTQAGAYANRLLAEQIIGKPIKEWDGNGWSKRGHELEDEAVGYYAVMNDVDCVRVGFVTDDEERYGCSPDRIVGDEGLLEIKCPAAHTHMSYLLNPERLENAYRVQVQGQLLVTGRAWCDLVSYFPELPEVTVRCERDESFIATLKDGIESLLESIEKNRKALEDKGVTKKEVNNV